MVAVPPDLVLVGRLGEAYGLKGAVHVVPYSREPAALLHAREWWLEGPGRQGLRDVEVLNVRAHGDGLVAQLMGVADRDLAEKLKGAQVHVARSRFPPLADEEYYWTDLVGLAVTNLKGEALGTVTGLNDNGAHAILELAESQADGTVRERLIPFVGAVVKQVDLKQRCITVDWEVDY